MCENAETFINHEAVLQFPTNRPQLRKSKWEIFWTVKNESNISSLLWEKPIKISKAWGEQQRVREKVEKERRGSEAL